MKTKKLLITIVTAFVVAAPLAVGAQTEAARIGPPLSGVTGFSQDGDFGKLFQTESASDPVREEKSKSKAMLYSLLIPGLGHQYAGDKGGAKTFFAVEAAIWASFIFFEVQGYMREESYQDYAQVFAGITSENKSDDFYSLIGQYNTWEEYEADIKNEGRFALYPEADSQTLEEYFLDNRVSDYEPWVWKTVDERRTFRAQRNDSKTSYRRALYAVAVAGANRIAAAFFSIRATNRANEGLDDNKVGYGLEFGAPVDHPEDFFETGVSFVATF
jgi:hypothetical protein